MMSRVYSACPMGVRAVPITVEVDVRGNCLKISIVGLPDAATRESKDRLIPAISNSGFALRSDEITINLSPADLRKEGMAYDLPMAIGILAAKGIVPAEKIERMMLVGELALDGTVRSVRSVLATAECARAEGFETLVVPVTNGSEAVLVKDLTILEVGSLAQLAHFLRGKTRLSPFVAKADEAEPQFALPDLRDVKGQAVAKRVLEIAAAGHHNLLMFGPPGAGKSMISKRLPGIMPPMLPEEIVEVTRIYSAAGKLGPRGRAIRRRPFRSPHHTASPIAMIGGGAYPRPGEVTLAHRGVLFLDEFPEFPRTVLEVLRQPMEDLQVTVSRANQQMTFPADFLLIAAMNPCPCGWRGDPRRACQCSGIRIQQYRARISGPLLDRIDLHVEVPSLSMATIRKLPPSESSREVLARVLNARGMQARRFGSPLVTNASMSPHDLRTHCKLPDNLAEMLEQKTDAKGCSARVHDKILRLARTIADLAGRSAILGDDLLEALGYRQLDARPIARARQAVEEAIP